MKRLYVGCRVRLVMAVHFPEMVGTETRIVGQGEGWSYSQWRYIPGWIMDCRNPDGKQTLGTSDQLEPIQDPGHEKVSWEECLWQPEGITA